MPVRQRNRDGTVRGGSHRSYRHDRIRKKKVEIAIRFNKAGQRKILEDDSIQLKQNQLVGKAPAVFIFPEDIALTGGPATFQRQFLDLYISQVDSEYLNNLISYKKILMQRNRLLKEIASENAGANQLEVWDKLLVDNGSKIMIRRDRFIDWIKDKATANYGILNGSSAFVIEYAPHLDLDSKNFTDALQNKLSENREREIRAGITLTGPHRDRISMALDTRSIRHFGSRGQKRCAMIAIKLATAEYISHETGSEIMLILDEVFAELDNRKSKALMKLLSCYSRVFLATAGEFSFADCSYTKYLVDKGIITKAKS